MGKYCSSTERCSPVTLTSTPGCRRSLITPLSRVSQHLSAHQLTPCIPSRPTGFKSTSDSWMTFVMYILFSYIIRIRESIEFFTRSLLMFIGCSLITTRLTNYWAHISLSIARQIYMYMWLYHRIEKVIFNYNSIFQDAIYIYRHRACFVYLDQTGMPTPLDLVNS